MDFLQQLLKWLKIHHNSKRQATDGNINTED